MLICLSTLIFFERKVIIMITYTQLWILLKSKNMKKTDLLEIMSSPTLAKLGKNEPVSVSVIEKICDYLNCQPADIMANEKAMTDQETLEVLQRYGDVQRVIFDKMKEAGMDEATFKELMTGNLPEFLNKVLSDKNVFEDYTVEDIKNLRSGIITKE